MLHFKLISTAVALLALSLPVAAEAVVTLGEKQAGEKTGALATTAVAISGRQVRPGKGSALTTTKLVPTGPEIPATRTAQSNYCAACSSDCGPAGPSCPDPVGTPDDWITNVTYAGINNNTFGEACPCSYGDYTGLSAFVTPGDTNLLSVSFCSEGMWSECVSVWIDWNQSKTFDANERYDLGCGIDEIVSMNITTPNNAVPGSTVMRVWENYEVYPEGPCVVTSWGEIEDYTVTVYGSDCCVGHPWPGCDDPSCESSVCSHDPFCCDLVWDTLCAAEAQTDPNCNCGGGGCNPGDEPANDLCATATSVPGPYPVQVMGDNTCATLDCPGVLDWNATWWAIDLPHASNDLFIDYCDTQPGAFEGGIVIYNDCTDCNAFILADNSAWSCPVPNAEMNWLGVPGPATVMFPAYYVDEDGNAFPYVLNIDVAAASGPCGDCPTDVNDSGSTDATDLAHLLGAWGPCGPGDPCVCFDADADGSIGAFDLATLLGAWGPCP